MPNQISSGRAVFKSDYHTILVRYSIHVEKKLYHLLNFANIYIGIVFRFKFGKEVLRLEKKKKDIIKWHASKSVNSDQH